MAIALLPDALGVAGPSRAAASSRYTDNRFGGQRVKQVSIAVTIKPPISDQPNQAAAENISVDDVLKGPFGLHREADRDLDRPLEDLEDVIAQ